MTRQDKLLFISKISSILTYYSDTTRNIVRSANPVLTPDGKQVTFCGRNKVARNFDIYLVNADGTGLRQLTNDWKRKVQPFFINMK